jgi:hypothetical protein
MKENITAEASRRRADVARQLAEWLFARIQRHSFLCFSSAGRCGRPPRNRKRHDRPGEGKRSRPLG